MKLIIIINIHPQVTESALPCHVNCVRSKICYKMNELKIKVCKVYKVVNLPPFPHALSLLEHFSS